MIEVRLSILSIRFQLADGFVIAPLFVPPRTEIVAMRTSPLATPVGLGIAMLEAEPAPKPDAATSVGVGLSFSR
ncbi:MAG: hypothetical protein E6H94_12865 [Chloroflexi bacterium]|nr:MAG: hypothetical protein E6H94_12865 [Chloroflexota bacterium]TMG38819.1 MAG: hypothetical protein E6H88_03590 [Chloroflexota bacterium]